jgi:hypothetical protein
MATKETMPKGQMPIALKSADDTFVTKAQNRLQRLPEATRESVIRFVASIKDRPILVPDALVAKKNDKSFVMNGDYKAFVAKDNWSLFSRDVLDVAKHMAKAEAKRNNAEHTHVTRAGIVLDWRVEKAKDIGEKFAKNIGMHDEWKYAYALGRSEAWDAAEHAINEIWKGHYKWSGEPGKTADLAGNDFGLMASLLVIKDALAEALKGGDKLTDRELKDYKLLKECIGYVENEVIPVWDSGIARVTGIKFGDEVEQFVYVANYMLDAKSPYLSYALAIKRE